MVERIPRRIFQGRLPPPAQQLLSLERAKQLLDGCARMLTHRGDRVDPEHLSDDGGVLDELLLSLRKSVEPSSDQPVHGLRRGQLGA